MRCDFCGEDIEGATFQKDGMNFCSLECSDAMETGESIPLGAEILDDPDEYDEEEPLVRVVNSTTIIADGIVKLDELSESLEVDIQGEGVETLGGYLMDAFGRIPSEGEKLERNGLEFAVEAVEEQRITRVRIVRPMPDSPVGDESE